MRIFFIALLIMVNCSFAFAEPDLKCSNTDGEVFKVEGNINIGTTETTQLKRPHINLWFLNLSNKDMRIVKDKYSLIFELKDGTIHSQNLDDVSVMLGKYESTTVPPEGGFFYNFVDRKITILFDAIRHRRVKSATWTLGDIVCKDTHFSY